MFGRKKRYETYGGTRVEMDPETGMPLVRDGERWEVSEYEGWAGDRFPLRVRLLSRYGRVLGERDSIQATREGIRAAAIGIAGARIKDGERDANIARLVGTYPPKTLN